MAEKLKSAFKTVLKLLSVFPIIISFLGMAIDTLRKKYLTIRDERLRKQLADAIKKAEDTKDTSDVERFFN